MYIIIFVFSAISIHQNVTLQIDLWVYYFTCLYVAQRSNFHNFNYNRLFKVLVRACYSGTPFSIVGVDTSSLFVNFSIVIKIQVITPIIILY